MGLNTALAVDYLIFEGQPCEIGGVESQYRSRSRLLDRNGFHLQIMSTQQVSIPLSQ